MMFFTPGLFYSQLDSLLEQEDVSLDDVLLDPTVLDECRGENKKLLAFLTQSTILKQLVNISVSGPDEALPLTDQFRKCHMASELLASNVPRLNYALLRDPDSLNLFYSTLLKPDVTSLASSFVYKILLALIQYSLDEMYSFFVTKVDLPCFLLTNMTRPAVLDIVFRVLQFSNSSEMSTVLSESTLIPDLLHRFPLTETQSASVQLLAGLLASCRLKSMSGSTACLTKRDPLLTKLESYETVQSLLSHMFRPPTSIDDQESITIESDESLINGLMYFRCLIDPGSRIEAGADLPPLPRLDAPYLWSEPVGRTLCELILPYLAALRQRLLVPAPNPENPPCPTSEGRPVRLTVARLHIARFLLYLFLAKSEAVTKELLRLDFLNILMDLFFEFSLNSFLHSTCENLIRLIVLRALLNSDFDSSAEQSPRASCSLDSADAVHRMFFSPIESENTETPVTVTDTQEKDVVTENAPSHPPPNLFWTFLHRLIVGGDLLNRIHKAWSSEHSDTRSRGNLGHLRLIANLLTAVIGPCKSLGEPDPALIGDQLNLIITTDHLNAVATNGCTYESKTNPELCSYICNDIPADTWTAWCEFVSGPLAQANERSYINYADFPNSLSSSDQTATDYKPSDMAISQALQNAYANYCTKPLTSTFMDQFGFAEDEFIEPSNHPNWVLDARLAEVSFSLHINEDTENSAQFEHACNDMIQLNDEEVGKESLCIPEVPSTTPTTPTPEESDPDKTICDSPTPAKSVEDVIPTRAKILEIFDELQSASSEDEAVLVGCSTTTTTTEDEDPDLVVIESGFRKSTAFSNLAEIDEQQLSVDIVNKHGQSPSALPALHEAEADDEQEKRNSVNAQSESFQIRGQFDQRSGPLTLSIPKYVQGSTNRNPGSCRRQLVNGTNGRLKAPRRPTPPVFQHVHALQSLQPFSVKHDEDEADEEDDELSPSESSENEVSSNRLGDMKQNGSLLQVNCEMNGIHPADSTSGTRIGNAHTNEYKHDGYSKMSPEISNRFPFTDSTWNHQFEHSTPSPESALSNHVAEESSADFVEDMENIELGDLSSGFSSLSPANRTLFDALQSNWNSDGGRRLIIPTKRVSSRNTPPHYDVHSRIPNLTNNAPVQNSSTEDLPVLSQPLIASEVTKSPNTSPSLLESNSLPNTSPLSPRTPTSCGMMASIKIRHAAKTHRLPPFVINENEFAPGDLLDDLRSGEVTTNGIGSKELLDSDFADLAHSTDLNFTKARYRSHRTLKLRPGADGDST